MSIHLPPPLFDHLQLYNLVVDGNFSVSYVEESEYILFADDYIQCWREVLFFRVSVGLLHLMFNVLNVISSRLVSFQRHSNVKVVTVLRNSSEYIDILY